MKLFECQNCGQLLYFENTKCESCGLRLGYLPKQEVVTALEEADGLWRALATEGEQYRFCANAEHDVCNWLVAAEDAEIFCASCRHNRTIPDLTNHENLLHWRKIEYAKHRLFYTLLRLRLPLATRAEDPNGLAFDFLSSPPDGKVGQAPIMTGHAGGLITLNVAEADAPERERQRKSMGEPYRTLLGHFRHEIEDYGAALKQHYAEGPPLDWTERFVTAYASAHPWEDFAETWAHYFHVVDTVETAFAFGLRMRPKVSKGAGLATVIDFDPYAAEMDRIIDAWLPLTFAVNSINRSMGQPDLYPFVLAPAVIWKLTFIHERIHAVSAEHSSDSEHNAIRAIVAGLRRAVGSPQ